MFSAKDNELVNRLLATAREGGGEWLPTALDNVFTSSVSGKYSFQIRRSSISDPPFRLEIRDEAGNVIHRLDFTDYPELAELHELARRQALKIDSTIDDILTELDKK